MPRSAFDRNDTSKIVVQAVRSLGVDADVNDRNDVCAGGYKICPLILIIGSNYIQFA